MKYQQVNRLIMILCKILRLTNGTNFNQYCTGYFLYWNKDHSLQIWWYHTYVSLYLFIALSYMNLLRRVHMSYTQIIGIELYSAIYTYS